MPSAMFIITPPTTGSQRLVMQAETITVGRRPSSLNDLSRANGESAESRARRHPRSTPGDIIPAMRLAIGLLAVLVVAPQSLPLAYPRAGVTALLENADVVVWNIP